MKTTRRNGHFSVFLPLVCGLMLIGLTAWLQAQPPPESTPPGGRPATTQPELGDEPAMPPVDETAQEEPKPRPREGEPPREPREESSRVRTSPRKADPPPKREPSPTEILRELTKQAGAPKPVIPPVTPGSTERRFVAPEALPPNAVRPPRARLLPDGYRLVDRPGRLAREGDYWVYAIEDRAQGDPELPIRLLPNRLLEDMERFSAGGTKPVVFVVSGEVTEYHNVNYLLVQKLLMRPDLGNFK